MKKINSFASKEGFISAFTLAEMMVVMLILSIVLAAMAPVMTTRYKSKPNDSSPWKYEANNKLNAYFGTNPSVAMIGQNQYTEGTDISAKLLINLGNSTNFLGFKSGNTNLGRLQMGANNLLLGNLASGNLGVSAVAFGKNVESGSQQSTAIGITAKSNAIASTAVGSNVTASGISSLAVGTSSNATADNSLAIGNAATGSGASAVAIGQNSTASATKSIAIGDNANTAKVDTIAIGSNAMATNDGAIAIGAGAKVAIAPGYDKYSLDSQHAIVIGTNAKAVVDLVNDGVTGATDAIAVGREAIAHKGSISIGAAANTNHYNSIAIGYQANAMSRSAISIGNRAISRLGAIAIGDNAEAQSKGAAAPIAIGYQAKANIGGATGSDSMAIGSSSVATGDNAVSIGYAAKALGKRNIALGPWACSHVTGANKICIGTNSGPAKDSDWAKDGAERIFIGSKSKYNNGPAVLEVHNTTDNVSLGNKDNVNSTAVVVNGNLVVKGSIIASLTELGNKAFNPTGGLYVSLIAKEDDARTMKMTDNSPIKDYAKSFPGDFVGAYSDRRLKYVGKASSAGLDKIRQLKVFNYTFKKDPKKEPHVGVIAQDLQKIFPNAVKKGADGFLTIRMEDMFYAVINAIKELDAKYQAQEKRINELEKRIEKLEAKVK